MGMSAKEKNGNQNAPAAIGDIRKCPLTQKVAESVCDCVLQLDGTRRVDLS